jgi:hypothetical protein
MTANPLNARCSAPVREGRSHRRFFVRSSTAIFYEPALFVLSHRKRRCRFAGAICPAWCRSGRVNRPRNHFACRLGVGILPRQPATAMKRRSDERIINPRDRA